MSDAENIRKALLHLLWKCDRPGLMRDAASERFKRRTLLKYFKVGRERDAARKRMQRVRKGGRVRAAYLKRKFIEKCYLFCTDDKHDRLPELGELAEGYPVGSVEYVTASKVLGEVDDTARDIARGKIRPLKPS